MNRPGRVHVGRTTTCKFLESSPIRDHQSSPAIVNQLFVAKRLCNACDARPVHSEDSCDMFVRQPEPVAIAAILKCQKPCTKALLNGMKGIAHHALRQVLDLRVEVVVQNPLEPLIGYYFALEYVTADRDRGSRHADLCAVRSSTRIERSWNSDRTFATNNPDLYRSPVFEDLKLGYDRRLGKVYRSHPIVLLIQILVLYQANALHELAQPQEMFGVDQLQQTVAVNRQRAICSGCDLETILCSIDDRRSRSN